MAFQEGRKARSEVTAKSTTTSVRNGRKQRFRRSLKSSTNAQSQRSPFLALPAEIKHRIYEFALSDWTFAIFDSPGPHQAHQIQQRQTGLDETISLSPVGSKLVSGPPGGNLMLTCREMYLGVCDLYGMGFTGRMVIGKVSNRLQHTLGLFLRQQSRLEKWYSCVHSLSVTISLDIRKLGFQIRSVFQYLQQVKVLIYSPGDALLPRPLHRVTDAALQGHYDRAIVRQAVRAMHAFFGFSPVWSELHQVTSPFEDKKGTLVDVKLVHWNSFSEAVLGYHICWFDNDYDVMNRVVREDNVLRYWSRDSDWPIIRTVHVEDQKSSRLPENFHWVQTEGGSFSLV